MKILIMFLFVFIVNAINVHLIYILHLQNNLSLCSLHITFKASIEIWDCIKD